MKPKPPVPRRPRPAARHRKILSASVLGEKSPLVTIREIDSLAQVRALSEGRARPRTLPTVPAREFRPAPALVSLESLFAVEDPPRPAFRRIKPPRAWPEAAP